MISGGISGKVVIIITIIGNLWEYRDIFGGVELNRDYLIVRDVFGCGGIVLGVGGIYRNGEVVVGEVAFAGRGSHGRVQAWGWWGEE
jgi:hypothetical protein